MKNILVIEDDDDDFLLLEEMLADFQSMYQLKRCQNYADAIRSLKETPFDACLVDYYLGAKTGFDVIREALKLGFQGPLILLTGADNADGVDEEALVIGADDYLSKDQMSPQLVKRTLLYNFQRKETEMRYRNSEAKYRQLAEISTSTLHNIGNVLNSLTVSSQTIESLVRHIDPIRLKKVATILEEQQLLSDHPKAALIPKYLNQMYENIHNGAEILKESVATSLERLKIAEQAIHVQQKTMRSQNDIYAISDVLEEALTIQRTKILQQNIEYEIVDDGTVCFFDRPSLLHILINLIKNAIEAMYEQPEKRLVLSVKKEDNWVRISVADTGCGISEKVLAKLFSHGFTTKTNGNGFGLHFCRQTLKRYDGTIACESVEGKGCLFTISLPGKYVGEV